MSKIYKTLFFFLLLSQGLLGQKTITGRVLDEDTKEGLAFCNVYVPSTTLGASTDIDGYFEIIVENEHNSLTASAMGYEEITKELSSETEQVINFSLPSSDLMIAEVVISAGENPANAFVRGIIANKDKNRPDALEAYHCEAYEKVELDLVNISEEMRESKLFKPFEFVFENIDSLSDEKPFLPAYITETVSDTYHLKGEKKKNIKRAQRVSGVENQTIVEFIGSMHQEFSVFDNWIYVLEKPFASPFSDMGFHYYEYYIIDSTYIEGQFAHKLKFKPKRKQENTFYGEFWVIDSTFHIQRLDMRMSPDVNINLVQRIIIYEEFQYLRDAYWLPKRQKVVLDFKPSKKSPGLIGRKTSSFKDYRLSTEEIINEYPKKDEEDYYLEELERSNDYWEEARHEKLSENEAAIYAIVDSVQNVPIYRTYVDVVRLVLSGYKTLGPVEVGPYFSLYSNNIVEGHRFRIGLRTNDERFSKKVRLEGYGAYGLKDRRFKYGGSVKWMINKRPRNYLEASYNYDIKLSNTNSEEFGQDNLLSGFYRRPLVQKLILTREAKLGYEKFWKGGWSNRLTLIHRDMDPYGGLGSEGGGFNYAYLPDPEISSQVDTTITTTELIFKTRFAKGEKFIDGDFSRTSLGTRYPRIELQYTLGIKGLLGSEYNYHKLTLGYEHYFYVNPIGWTSYKIKAGKVFGQLPFLLAEAHPGNETFFIFFDGFNGMNTYEFASDTYASIIVDHHFDGFILNKIPLIRKLEWRTVATFRAVIGSMSPENQAANRLNAFDFSVDGEDTYQGFRSPSAYPYMETGVGIENIFKFIRVDLLWRLNYLDNPNAYPLTFRVGFDFNF